MSILPAFFEKKVGKKTFIKRIPKQVLRDIGTDMITGGIKMQPHFPGIARALSEGGAVLDLQFPLYPAVEL